MGTAWQEKVGDWIDAMGQRLWKTLPATIEGKVRELVVDQCQEAAWAAIGHKPPPESTQTPGRGSPLTDAELDAVLDMALDRDPWMRADLERAVAEIHRLRTQVQGHAERIAAQSELLSRRAAKPPPGGGLAWTKEPPTEPGWYWWRVDPSQDAEAVLLYADRFVTRSGVPSRLETPENMEGEWAGPLTPPGGTP